jgi:Flp pilus assembly protein TadB
MTAVTAALRELAGLFVDDGALALGVLVIVAVAAILAALTPGLWAGAVLLVGCLGVLLTSVISAARRRLRQSRGTSG